MPNPLHQLEHLFRRFPGIGPRQAKRFVYFLLQQDNGYRRELSERVAQLAEFVSRCHTCARFFVRHGEETTCSICTDTTRDHGLLMVVGTDTDLENMEKSGAYHGRYFVLGGTLPTLEEHPEMKVRINELKNLVIARRADGNPPREIILALSATPDGEYTAEYVSGQLHPLLHDTETRLSTLGRGISAGTELEYSDVDTLKAAFENRK